MRGAIMPLNEDGVKWIFPQICFYILISLYFRIQVFFEEFVGENCNQAIYSMSNLNVSLLNIIKISVFATMEMIRKNIYLHNVQI